MDPRTENDNRKLIEFWNSAFAMSEEDRAEERERGQDGWKDTAPSEKLFDAACSLASKKKVLDYGCGNAWAGIAAAKSGCPDVTAVDVSAGAAEMVGFYADLYGTTDRIHISCVDPDWLSSVPDGSFDGIICSNVIDVVPPETAANIIEEFSRIAAGDAAVIIGMNYYMSPEKAAKRGTELVDGNKVYVDGVLRLVSRSDAEWAELFSECFSVKTLDHFAWPGEEKETRRLFVLGNG